MEIDEAYVIQQYQENNSTYSIAKELNTYPKKIERILKKNGYNGKYILNRIFNNNKDIKSSINENMIHTNITNNLIVILNL